MKKIKFLKLGLDTKVLNISCCEKFVKNLPNGVKTLVGEKGYNLSGGQRQRIGIARALYKNPSILIFDESTNSLDQSTEKKVMENILNYMKKMSFIMISHRSNLKGYFDENIEMTKDKIILKTKKIEKVKI